MPVTESPLLLKLEALRESMSKTESRITDYILENPRSVLDMGIGQFAELCGASEASIIRLCKRLGVRGFQQLKVTLAMDLSNPISSDRKDLLPSDTAGEIARKVFHNAIHTLEFSMGILDMKAVAMAVDALYSAHRVLLLGMGGSSGMVLELQNKLLRVGLDVVGVTDFVHQQIRSWFLQEGDVCLAISYEGVTPELVKAVQFAKEAGAQIITITTIGRNPLADLADIRLDYASGENYYLVSNMPSRISVHVYSDILHAALAMRFAQREGETLAAMDRVLDLP